MNPDLINSMFEFVGTGAVALSAYECYKNKSAAGAHWLSASFFFVWGMVESFLLQFFRPNGLPNRNAVDDIRSDDLYELDNKLQVL